MKASRAARRSRRAPHGSISLAEFSCSRTTPRATQCSRPRHAIEKEAGMHARRVMLVSVAFALGATAFAQESVSPLAFSDAAASRPLAFLWTLPDDPCARRFAAESGVRDAIEGRTNDFDRATGVATWLLAEWKPMKGSADVDTTDPLGLWKRARNGQCPSWCYQAVLRAALCSIGIPARSVLMHTADVETRQCCA